MLALVTILVLVNQVRPESQLKSDAVSSAQFDEGISQQMHNPTEEQGVDESSTEDIPEETNTKPEAEPKDAATLFARMGVVEKYHDEFAHGDKTADQQKYIMLHDTESWSSPQSIIDYWVGNGNLVATHFIVGTDGMVYQCVPMNKIAHHAGFGNAGHNVAFEVTDESRDDKLGTVPIGSTYPDYGMNSYSIGIEMVHVGGGGEYPVAQLEALDKLIAYIDAYYGFKSSIVAHNDWRTSNSDTSAEFADCLSNYQNHRSYKSQ